jgi:Rap guanine nucleotide exchange factor 1
LFRPPCIPYVGLVLQDLTFVHIGNPDTFDGKVNFAKRWQQFNILVSTKCNYKNNPNSIFLNYKKYYYLQDNLMRFKKDTYPFGRRDDIIHYFDDFVTYWSEDQMWEVSETIKPRGRRKDTTR